MSRLGRNDDPLSDFYVEGGELLHPGFEDVALRSQPRRRSDQGSREEEVTTSGDEVESGWKVKGKRKRESDDASNRRDDAEKREREEETH